MGSSCGRPKSQEELTYRNVANPLESNLQDLWLVVKSNFHGPDLAQLLTEMVRNVKRVINYFKPHLRENIEIIIDDEVPRLRANTKQLRNEVTDLMTMNERLEIEIEKFKSEKTLEEGRIARVALQLEECQMENNSLRVLNETIARDNVLTTENASQSYTKCLEYDAKMEEQQRKERILQEELRQMSNKCTNLEIQINSLKAQNRNSQGMWDSQNRFYLDNLPSSFAAGESLELDDSMMEVDHITKDDVDSSMQELQEATIRDLSDSEDFKATSKRRPSFEDPKNFQGDIVVQNNSDDNQIFTSSHIRSDIEQQKHGVRYLQPKDQESHCSVQIDNCLNNDGHVSNLENNVSVDVDPEEVNRNEALNLIRDIDSNINRIEEQIEDLKYHFEHRQCLHLKELLVRAILKLDNIESHGDLAVRVLRSETVSKAQMLVNQLRSEYPECA